MKKQIRIPKSFLEFSSLFEKTFIDFNIDFIDNLVGCYDNQNAEKKFVFVVGVSGGPDSMALLLLLKKLVLVFEKKFNIKINLLAVHINHRLRKTADDDEKLVKEFCLKKNIDFISKKISIKNSKNGLEENARKKRYEIFSEILHENLLMNIEKNIKEGTAKNKEALKVVKPKKNASLKSEENSKNKKNLSNAFIFTAHHKDDQIETLLMRMLRGSSISGLKGIEKFKCDKRTGINLVRPLLCFSKNEILDYIKKNKVKFAVDKTNEESKFTRNKIRNKLVPYLKKNFNPNIDEAIIKLCESSVESSEHIEKEVENFFNTERKKKNISIGNKNKTISFKISIFKEEDLSNASFFVKNFLLFSFQIIGLYDYSSVHMNSLLNAIRKNVGNKVIEFPDFFTAEIKNKKVVISRKNK